MTQVTLGNFFTTSDGKNILGGAGGSGLDTQSLIKTLVTAKSAPATQDQDQITVNDAQSTALNTFQTLLSTFQTTLDALRNPPGVGNEANNVFKFATASVTSNSGVTGSNFLTASAQPGASLQNYTIDSITNVATAATQSTGPLTVLTADSSVVAATSTAGRFTAGNFTIKGQSITLNAGDSLNDIAAKFNAVSTGTGINATVIQVASGTYTLSFSATATGSTGSFDLGNSGTNSNTALFANVSLTTAVAGTPANFSINGIPVTRQSNNISDLINGVTFNLLAATPTTVPPTSLTVSVQPDTTTTQNSIVSFVNAYNAIKTFAAQQTQLNSDGTFATTAVLANNQAFRTTINDITQQVTGQVNGLANGQPSNLSDLGITLTTQPASGTMPQVDNILTVNDGQLSSALSTNFAGVSNVFGFNLTADNADLKLFSSSNSFSVNNFTLTIDPSTNTFDAAYTVGGSTVHTALTASPLPGTGYTLSGPSGTPLAGLVFIYGSAAAATIHVTATQGIADQVFNSTSAATTANTGTLAVELKSLQTSDTQLNADITRINTQVNTYQQQLLQQFANLETTISSVNTLLDSLTANQNAALTASGN